MFEDQKVELLPERTTMHMSSWTAFSSNASYAVAANVANIASGRGVHQTNMATALSLAGVSIGH
jgi:hypothetical protein